MVKELYPPHLLAHYHHSPYRGALPDAHVTTQVRHPSCGDIISLTAYLEGSIITQIGFTGSGCILSQAATSLLAQRLQGSSITEALALSVEDMKKLLGLEVGILRAKCIMLALEAFQEALKIKQR